MAFNENFQKSGIGDLNHDHIKQLLHKKIYSKETYNFYTLSFQLPLLFVFLRHLGCAFCHRTLLDLRMEEQNIQLEGSEIVLIHMTSPSNAQEVFELYELNNQLSISDTEQELYKAFSLKRGKIQDIYNPKIWLDTSHAEELSHDVINPKLGDPLQMPGIFSFYGGKVQKGFWYESIADRPPYSRLAVSTLLASGEAKCS